MVGVNPSLEPPSLNSLQQAFRGIVDSLVEHRQRRDALANGARSFGRFLSYAEIANADYSVLRAVDIVQDPVGFALKRGIKSLGQVIYDIYGMEALEATAERVCDGSPGSFGARMSPVDAALDGVGKGSDRWGS
jgi:hypothetical protein